MRNFEFIKPQIKVEQESSNYGKFVVTPLERGYGMTLGNSLRRVLLSSMPGVAIVAMEVEGVPHEFMALPGVVEDVVEIILNLKNVKYRVLYFTFILKKCDADCSRANVRSYGCAKYVLGNRIGVSCPEGGTVFNILF